MERQVYINGRNQFVQKYRCPDIPFCKIHAYVPAKQGLKTSCLIGDGDGSVPFPLANNFGERDRIYRVFSQKRKLGSRLHISNFNEAKGQLNMFFFFNHVSNPYPLGYLF